MTLLLMHPTALNLLTRVIDPLGHQIEFTYDSRNHLLTMTNPNGNVTRRSYDANGNLLTQTNALNQTTRYEYDGEDRLSRVFDAKGNMTQLSYDAKGRVVTITDPLGYSRQIKYDEVDNVLQRFDALGKLIASFGYDATHLVTSQRDALNQQTRFEYDNLGRLTQTTDPLNRVTQLAYDALNRLTHSLDALQGISQQGFDADGNRTDLIDPNGNETQFSFDKDGRLVQEKVATGHSINYHYNHRDLLAQVVNGRGQQREFAYDAANRLVSISDVDGTISFTYDNNGNILTVKDNQGTITRTYDALNRVTSYTDVNGNTIQYEYDSIGNLATLTYPDGKQVHYNYNALNQLIQVIDWAGRITQYEYDANGRLIKTTRPNGTQQLRHYDAKGQLLQQQDVFNQTVITQFDYRYDAVGNIIEETKQPANPVPNIQLEMSYAAANQLATVNQQAVESDADGNIINGMLKGQLTSFSFDSRNRLIQAADTTYCYDAENQRIAVNDTQYVINSQPNLSQVLVRTKGNGEVTYYVYGLGLIGEESAGNYFSYHFDYRGSTVVLTDNTGQVVDRVAYSAYGELLTQPTHDTPFLFNGMYGVMSDDNGLYYMRARFYSPEIKRFINQDVLLGNIADGQSLNRFAFVTGQPINFIDPWGLFELADTYGNPYTGIPIINKASERKRSILDNTPAIFNIMNNPNADGSSPWYESHSQNEVMQNEQIIMVESSIQGVDPNLVMSIVYMETTHGWYDSIPPLSYMNKSVRPMNIHVEYWEGLGYSREQLQQPEINIRVGILILKRIIERIQNPTVEKIASIYNFLGNEKVTDYGARVKIICQEQPWLEQGEIVESQEIPDYAWY